MIQHSICIQRYKLSSAIVDSVAGGSSNGSEQMKDAAAGHSSASDSDITSLGPRSALPLASGNGNGSSNGSEQSSGTQVAGQAKDIAGSRQSFKIAMGNPCEMFVDVM